MSKNIVIALIVILVLAVILAIIFATPKTEPVVEEEEAPIDAIPYIEEDFDFEIPPEPIVDDSDIPPFIPDEE